MKTNIYIIISLFILIVLGISLSNKSEKTTNTSGLKIELQSPADTTILIGAYDIGNLKESYKIKDSLGFNLWHKYLTGIRDISGRALPHGWIQYEDSLYKMDYSYGFDSVKSIFDSNSMRDIKMLMMRPKTEWICYGQRSDYQCEDTVENPEYNWFYTYRDHECGIDYTDTSRFGNGVKVRYCSQNPQDSGYVVKGLKTNREQINMKYYPGMGDIEAKWYLKPRIRIDSAFAYNNPLEKVCRIEIYNFKDSLIKKVDIFGNSFWEDSIAYYGQYIENFYRNIPNQLILYSSFMLNPDTLAWTNTNCKVDYRVFWYGNCDMWIDYFRVDDERANILFGDTTNYLTREFYDMLQLEVDLASQYTSSLDFYIDEFEFNHLPCIKKVSEIIRSKSNNRFSINFVAGYDWWYWAHLPGDSIPPFTVQKNHYIKYCIDSVKPKYVIGGDYPFDTNRLYPSSLTPPDPNSQYLFGSPATAGVYDNWLQGYLDTTKELNNLIQSDIRSIYKVKSTNSGDTKITLIPKEYSLSQNYPNPFNPVTKINFALPKEGKVKIVVYDMLGREVAKIINNEDLSAGTYIREFNGSNLASGVYFLRILVNDENDFSDVKKTVLLK